jgi:hypothetical protein
MHFLHTLFENSFFLLPFSFTIHKELINPLILKVFLLSYFLRFETDD